MEDESAVVTLQLNGQTREISAPGDEALVTTLRRLGLRSVRGACGIGMCGTCSVLVDGKVASSCLLLTRQVAGRSLCTSEGLVTDDGTLSAVQQAFVDARAYQCSYCIPGMVVSVEACLQERPDASLEDVREYLAGNLCRCGTYPQIMEAVHALLTGRD